MATTTAAKPGDVTDLALSHTEELAMPDTQSSAAMAKAQAEVQSAVLLAKRFPRNEEACYGKLMKACDRLSFADAAAYCFPRGGTDVTGPSAPFAREFARVWGNVRYGARVLRDTDESRLIQGWAWDLESNAYTESDDEFKKLVQRKRQGKTEWVEPDERDLRELTNRRAAILVRNCLLSIVPKDMVEDALRRCDQTLQNGVRNDPDAWKKVLTAFAEINVDGDDLASFLGHNVTKASPAEIAKLRQIYQSIAQGNTKWSDYMETTPGTKAATAAAGAEETLAEKLRKQKEKTQAATPQPTSPPAPAAEGHAVVEEKEQPQPTGVAATAPTTTSEAPGPLWEGDEAATAAPPAARPRSRGRAQGDRW